MNLACMYMVIKINHAIYSTEIQYCNRVTKLPLGETVLISCHTYIMFKPWGWDMRKFEILINLLFNDFRNRTVNILPLYFPLLPTLIEYISKCHLSIHIIDSNTPCRRVSKILKTDRKVNEFGFVFLF